MATATTPTGGSIYTGTVTDTNITSGGISLGGGLSYDGSIYSAGIDFGTGNSSSATYSIRANSQGELNYGDIINYIDSVNTRKIEPVFRYDSSIRRPSVTSTGTSSNIYSTNINDFVLKDPFDNSVRWYSDAGIITTSINADWTLALGEVDRKALKRSKIKSGLTIITKSRANILPKSIPENERVAIETLREEVSELEYRRYLKYGFVLVKGASGDTYQIFRNKSHTKVWRNGKLIEEVCVRISDHSVPPTDNVIAFKNIIGFSEDEFKKLGNVYKMQRAA